MLPKENWQQAVILEPLWFGIFQSCFISTADSVVSRKLLGRILPSARQILYVKLLALTLNIPITVSVRGAYLQLVLCNYAEELGS